jgi:hypothetical protein
MATALRRFSRLDGAGRARLAEALATLALASLAIKLAPFKRVVQAAGRRDIPERAPIDRALVEQCRWSVDAAANRVPWKAVCFQRGLALHLMLRRRGVPSVLHYGVAQTSGRGLAAHVWVSAGGEVVLGGKEAPDYVCLATFPGPRAS